MGGMGKFSKLYGADVGDGNAIGDILCRCLSRLLGKVTTPDRMPQRLCFPENVVVIVVVVVVVSCSGGSGSSSSSSSSGGGGGGRSSSFG
ncbi:hypothetical protein PABG_12612 [Paracoccidioides brasiliensis Pb03]|nr:hypothetical protein PABG_12612 [Paracoccidioides brasiliensis Pb03]